MLTPKFKLKILSFSSFPLFPLPPLPLEKATFFSCQKWKFVSSLGILLGETLQQPNSWEIKEEREKEKRHEINKQELNLREGGRGSFFGVDTVLIKIYLLPSASTVAFLKMHFTLHLHGEGSVVWRRRRVFSFSWSGCLVTNLSWSGTDKVLVSPAHI